MECNRSAELQALAAFDAHQVIWRFFPRLMGGGTGLQSYCSTFHMQL